jgi:hypothetical protein
MSDDQNPEDMKELQEEIKAGKELDKVDTDEEREAAKQKRKEELEALKQAMIDSGQWEEPPADEEQQ